MVWPAIGCLMLLSVVIMFTGDITKQVNPPDFPGVEPGNKVARPSQSGNLSWYREVETNRYARFFVYTASDAIYTLGSTSSFLLIKWDLQGNEIWRRTSINLPLGITSSFESLWGSDGMIYICGYLGSQTLANNSFLAAFDASGNFTWASTWNADTLGWPHDLWCDNTGIYTVCKTLAETITLCDAAVLKWDLAGHLVWSRVSGDPGYDSGESIWGDGSSIYVLGSTDNQTQSIAFSFISKYNSTGGLLWRKTCAGTAWTFAKGIFGTTSGIFSCSFSSSSDTQTLMKWTVNGDPVWSRTTSSRYSASIWGDANSIYLCGSITSNAGDVFVAKYDASGVEIWQRTWGSRDEDMGGSICGNNDAVYTGGYVASPFAYRTNALLIRWSYDGIAAPYIGFEPEFIPYAFLFGNLGFIVYLGLALHLKATNEKYRRVQLGKLAFGAGLVALTDSIMSIVTNMAFQVFSLVTILVTFSAAVFLSITAMVLAGKSGKSQEREGLGSAGGCMGLLALIPAGIVFFFAIIGFS